MACRRSVARCCASRFWSPALKSSMVEGFQGFRARCWAASGRVSKALSIQQASRVFVLSIKPDLFCDCRACIVLPLKRKGPRRHYIDYETCGHNLLDPFAGFPDGAEPADYQQAIPD